MTTEYEAIPEAEWKVLATTEIAHLTDEEKDYLPAAWDEWIARVRRAAKAEALREASRAVPFPIDPYGGFDYESLRAAYVQITNSLRDRADKIEAG